jgi:hypothetical protein
MLEILGSCEPADAGAIFADLKQNTLQSGAKIIEATALKPPHTQFNVV